MFNLIHTISYEYFKAHLWQYLMELDSIRSASNIIYFQQNLRIKILFSKWLKPKQQPNKMVKNTQTIRWLLTTNSLSVIVYFVGLVLKELRQEAWVLKLCIIFTQSLTTVDWSLKNKILTKVENCSDQRHILFYTTHFIGKIKLFFFSKVQQIKIKLRYRKIPVCNFLFSVDGISILIQWSHYAIHLNVKWIEVNNLEYLCPFGSVSVGRYIISWWC